MSEKKESFRKEKDVDVKISTKKLGMILDVLLENEDLSNDPEVEMITISREKFDGVVDDIVESLGVNIHTTAYEKILELNADWRDIFEKVDKEREETAKDVKEIAIRNKIELNEEQLSCFASMLCKADLENRIENYQKAIELAELYCRLQKSSSIKIGSYPIANCGWIIKLLIKETPNRIRRLPLLHYSLFQYFHFFDDVNDDKRKECVEALKEKLKEEKNSDLKYVAQELGKVLHPNLVVVKNGKQMKYFPKKEAAFIFDLLVYRGVIDNKEYYDDAEKYDRIKRFLQAEIDN